MTGRSGTPRTAQPVVSSDTLISLRVADPQNTTAERWLPDEVYDKAFDAWEVARDSAYDGVEGADRSQRLPARSAACRSATPTPSCFARAATSGGSRRLNSRTDFAASRRRRCPARSAEPSTRAAPTKSASRSSPRCSTKPASPRRRRASLFRTSREHEVRLVDMDGRQGDEVSRGCRMTFDARHSVDQGCITSPVDLTRSSARAACRLDL